MYGDGREFGFGSVQERAARGGEPDAFDFVHAAAAEALVDGVMFAVDRKQGLASFASGGGDEFAGGNQTFFVGEADGLSGFDGFVSSFEPGDADDGADYEIDVGMGGDFDCASAAVDDFDFGEAVGFEFGAESGGVGFGGDGKDAGLPSAGLLVGGVDVRSGG